MVGVDLQFKNHTSVAWYRHHHVVTHGSWHAPPPECLPSAGAITSINCLARSCDFSAVIHYAFICRNVEYTLAVMAFFKSANVLMGQTLFSESHKPRLLVSTGSRELSPLEKSSSLNSYKLISEEFPTASTLFTADLTISDNQPGTLEILIQETTFGNRFLEECRMEMYMKFDRVLLNWEKALSESSKMGIGLSETAFNSSFSIGSDDDEEFRVIPPTEEEWEFLSSDHVITKTPQDREHEDNQNGSPFLGSDTSPLDKTNSHGRFKSRSHHTRVLQAIMSIPRFSMRRILANALNKQIPQSFVWTVKNTKWQSRLRSAKLSLFIRIVNNTSYYLVYDTDQSFKTLTDCNFIEFPSETILPFGVTEFGVASDKFGLKNYSGKIVYSVYSRFADDPTLPAYQHRQSNYLIFSFEYFNSPPVSRHKIQSGHVIGTKPGSLLITKDLESYNEGTLIFRVFDPADQVYFQAVAAYAFKPSNLTRVLGAPPCCGGVQYGQQMAKYAASIKARGTNITQQFCAAVFRYCDLFNANATASNTSEDASFIKAENVSYVDNLGEPISTPAIICIDPDIWAWTGLWDKDSIRSAGDAVRHLVCTTAFDMPSVRTLLQEMGIHDPVQSIYVEYKIGAELFHAVFQAAESLEMRTDRPGGFKACDKTVLLSSRAADYKSMISPLLKTQLWQWEKRLLRGELGSTDFRDAFLSLKRSKRSEKLIALAHRALLLLCEGFAPYLLRQCQISRPEDWTEVYDVPECHVWEKSDGSEPFLDAQGLILYVTINWTEKMSDIFPEGIALFHPVRELTARWSIQDYNSITATLVHQCVESAATILQRIGEIRLVMALKTVNETISQLYGEESLAKNPNSWGPACHLSTSPTTDASSSGQKAPSSVTRLHDPEYISRANSGSPAAFNWVSFGAKPQGTPFDDL